jgi:spore coat protein U-like protein
MRLGMILALAQSIAANPAAGATAVASFQVSAAVVPACTIVASDLAFGAYDPFVANATTGLDATATLTLTCTSGMAGAVAVDGGLYGGSAAGGRHMASGAQRLAYEVFKDASHVRLWGAGPDGAVAIVGGGASHPDRVMLFGRIPPGQIVLSGRYTDSITATVQF